MRTLNDMDIVVLTLFWLLAGMWFLKKVAISPAFQSTMVETAGHRWYAEIMRLVSLVTWPISPITCTLLFMLYVKAKGIKIPKE